MTRTERMLADLIAAAEGMADKLRALEVTRLDGDGRPTGMLVVSPEGDPVFEWTPGKDTNAEAHAYGYIAVREWNRILDDARREGIIP